METAFDTIRAALFKIASDAIDAETAAPRPCPDYSAHLAETLESIRAARSIDCLARVAWVAGQAALGAETLESDV